MSGFQPIPLKNAEERLSWAREMCLKSQMRLTPIRERILSLLAAGREPLSLEAIMQVDGIRNSCDEATAYRTLMLFRELEITRQVSLPNKVSYFVLNIPGESGHFLICRCCGVVNELATPAIGATLEREVAATQGYTQIYHETVFFGICPTCQKHPADVVCAKVQPRMRTNNRLKPRSTLDAGR